MGKSIISMAIFNSYVWHNQRVTCEKLPEGTTFRSSPPVARLRQRFALPHGRLRLWCLERDAAGRQAVGHVSARSTAARWSLLRKMDKRCEKTWGKWWNHVENGWTWVIVTLIYWYLTSENCSGLICLKLFHMRVNVFSRTCGQVMWNFYW